MTGHLGEQRDPNLGEGLSLPWQRRETRWDPTDALRRSIARALGHGRTSSLLAPPEEA